MDIAAWLRSLGLGRYAAVFEANDVDVELLPKLTADDLIGLGVTSIGHRRKLLEGIAALTAAPAETEQSAAQAEPAARSTSSEAERRQLTVMFVDLVGSTELSAQLDPEDMSQVIRAYQAACNEVVERWGGHVAKYMGDGVLAYFGWPQAHEDEAERAVRAGLELATAVGRLKAGEGAPLAARTGIATGLVMVGELIGQGESQERTVVGDTPNIAARLQSLAQAGSVVIAPNTRRLLGGLFDLEDLGAYDLKGFAEPVRAWRVIGETLVRDRLRRFGASA